MSICAIAIHMPARKIYIYENNRYNPVSGWSSKTLMPTDRKALSNRDGSDGYNSLEEADVALISKGWVWDNDTPWTIERALADIDAEGWTYSVDFTSLTNDAHPDAIITCGGNSVKGMMHFVRRRKLYRMQYFDVSTMTDTSKFTCDHCDLKEVEKLNKLLLDRLTQASINKHPRSLTERKMNILKNELIDVLGLADKSSSSTSAASTVVTAVEYMKQAEDDMQAAVNDDSFLGTEAYPRPSLTNSEDQAAGAAPLPPPTAATAAVPMNSSKGGDGGIVSGFLFGSSGRSASTASSASTTVNSSTTGTAASSKAAAPFFSSSSKRSNSTANAASSAVTSNSSSLAAAFTASSNSSSSYYYEKVMEILDIFVSKSRTTLSMASSAFISSDEIDHWQTRQQELLDHRCYFTSEERLEISRCLIRKYDRKLLYHCSAVNCGQSCHLFYVENCQNEGCSIRFSRKWYTEHDSLCPEKILPCERVCGEVIKRKDMSNHVSLDCILRPVTCPFHDIGCSHHAGAGNLLYKDLADHLQVNTTEHLQLCYSRLLEQQTMIARLHITVGDLERSREQLSQEVSQAKVAIAAMTAAMKVSENKQERALKEEIAKVDAKYSRQVTALNNDVVVMKRLLNMK